MLARWYAQITAYTLAHLPLISVALAATLLTIYTPDLTRVLKRRVRKWPLLARSALFIGVMGVGFGAAVLALRPLVGRLLLALGRPWLLPLIFGAVITLGLLAERRKQL